METNQDEIVKLASCVVESFINDKVPLNEGIAKCASENALNEDQLKRLIETSNSTAYLELMKTAQDRTFEFPVAEYSQVMVKVAFPQDLILDIASQRDPGKVSTGDGRSINKKDIGTEPRTRDDEMLNKQASHDELLVLLSKQQINNKVALEKAAVDKQIICLEIDEAIRALRKDTYALEKLAEVSEEAEFTTLQKFFHEKKALEQLVFRDNELKTARNLVGLLKAAKEIIAEEQKLATIEKRSRKILQKCAGVPKGVIDKVPDPGLAVKGVRALNKGLTIAGVGNKLNLLGAISSTPKNDVWKELHG